MSYEVQPDSICFQNLQPPNDCVIVAWGSSEQFTAEFDSAGRTGLLEAPVGTTFLLPVTFEIPGNATLASLVFGEHRVPIDLQGDAGPVQTLSEPLAAPTPPPGPSTPEATVGYFMDDAYGIAITGVLREPDQSSAVLANVAVSFALLSLYVDNDLAPAIRSSNTPGQVCFVTDSEDECMGISWGDQGQYNAMLSLSPDGVEAWPRGLGWEARVSFQVPISIANVTLSFGEHRIPLDLRGMKGERPPYAYTAHYPELSSGSVLYESDNKTVLLEGIEHDPDSGEMTLVFSAANGSEASDFAPQVGLTGARVSAAAILDGRFDEARGWVPSALQIWGSTLAPGQTGSFELKIPRVGPSDNWRYIPYFRRPEYRPDVVITQLTATDALTDAGTNALAPAYAQFKRDYWPSGGSLVWKYQTGGRVISSPTVADGIVYVGSEDEHVYALSAYTGEIAWRYHVGSHVFSSPAVADGFVYVGSGDFHLHALNADTGELSWRHQTGGDVFTSPTVADGVVYVGSGDREHLHALDAYTGELVWQYRMGDDIASSPTVADGIVFVGVRGGTLHALNADTGKRVWRYQTGEYVLSSPIVADGIVYVASDEHEHVHALNADTGDLIWRSHLGEGVLALPTLADGIIYVGSDAGLVYALNANRGQVVWQYETDSHVYSSPTVADGIVYIGSGDNHVYALNASTGELVWRHQTGRDVDSSPTVADGIVYIGSDDGYLYALVASAQP